MVVSSQKILKPGRVEFKVFCLVGKTNEFAMLDGFCHAQHEQTFEELLADLISHSLEKSLQNGWEMQHITVRYESDPKD